MVTLSPGKIYLSDLRGLTETKTFRRYATFNYADYHSESRQPFGNLEVLNDELLAAGGTVSFQIKQNAFVVLVPITGGLLVKDNSGKNSNIDVGEVYVDFKPANSNIELTNSYKEDWINFLYLQFTVAKETSNTFNKTYNFDLERSLNTLQKVVFNENDANQTLPFSINIGRFNGREEAVINTKNKNSLFFAFVIAGAFELQNRLLHERDGLALWDLETADMEALSNNAVIMLIELENT